MSKSPIRYGDLLKTKCLGSMLDYTRYVFKTTTGNKLKVWEHQRIICEALDKVIRGETKRLIINIAPRFGKTQIAVKSFIEYGLSLNPSSKFLHLSYSDDLVLDSSKEIRTTLQDDNVHSLFGVNITSNNNKSGTQTKEAACMRSVPEGRSLASELVRLTMTMKTAIH